jgi:PAS domain S-box-containing protein
VSAARESARKASALARIAASMTYAGTLEATLDALARSVVEATGMAACLVWVLDDGHQLRVAGTYGFPEGYRDALEVIARSGVALVSMQALEERRTLVFPDTRVLLLRDAGFAPLHHFLAVAPWDTLVCLPLIFHDAPLGTLVAHFHGTASPDEAALSFLGAIADQAAVAVENARLVAAQAAEALEERRLAQTLAQQKETQYRAIFEATSDGMVIRDHDGHAVEMNQAYCAMHGYSREEMLKLPPSSHVHPDYRGSFAEFLETIRWGGTYRAQAIDVRQDGTPFHVDVRGTPIIYQGKPHVLGIVRDITEQAEAYRLLEQRVEERTRELSTVLEVSHDMASTLELQPLLGLILAHLRQVVDYAETSIITLEGDALIFAGYWGPARAEDVIGQRVSLARAAANRQVIESRAPAVIPNIWDEQDPLGSSFRQVGLEDLGNPLLGFHSWLGVPLIYKERVIGMLSLLHTQPRYYTSGHARLALAIANHAAVAMENARLYSRAQQVAALEERARLARELHDSVSQALYGIALGAQTARSLLARDPSKVVEPLDYVLSLAEAGLTEMRALIFALRPESLATEGLVAALEHQVAALRSRYELQVDASLGAEPEAAYEVKEALYRIVQEALHNTVKHARARQVRVSLEEIEDRLALSVEDDGAGFDTGEEFRGHLGLRSMRERAESLGGRLTVESAPGMGTRLRVWMPSQGLRG